VVKIDSRVEPLVREALAALIKADADRFARALAAFGDQETGTAGSRLAVVVAFHVLLDRYGGQPAPEEVRALAEQVAELEDWTDLTADEIELFIGAYFAGTSVDTVMPIERAVLVSFVLAANLLASYRRDGEWWFDHLDRVEAALEAASSPSRSGDQ
jgi:hypothetical protein